MFGSCTDQSSNIVIKSVNVFMQVYFVYMSYDFMVTYSSMGSSGKVGFIVPTEAGSMMVYSSPIGVSSLWSDAPNFSFSLIFSGDFFTECFLGEGRFGGSLEYQGFSLRFCFTGDFGDSVAIMS